MKIFLFLTAFAVAAHAVEPAQMPALRKFAENALFAGPNDRVKRWVNAPLVTCWSDNAEEQALCTEVVGEFNKALEQQAMRLLTAPKGVFTPIGPNSDPAALINVHFANEKEIPGVNRLYGIPRDRIQAQPWRWWNEDHSMRRCVIIVPRRGLTREQVRRELVFDFLFCLGLSGNAPGQGDTIYGDSKSSGLRSYDSAVLALLYSQLTPGMSNDQVRSAVNRHWSGLR